MPLIVLRPPASAAPAAGCAAACEAFLLVARLVDCADHVERAFLPLVAFAGEDRLAAGNRVGDGDRAAGHAGKGFRHGKGLRQKALQTPRPLDDAAVLGAELLDAEQRDHILQLAVMLDIAADLGGDG